VEVVFVVGIMVCRAFKSTLGVNVNTGWFLDREPLRVITMLGELTMDCDVNEDREANVSNDAEFVLDRRRRARQRTGSGRGVGTLRV